MPEKVVRYRAGRPINATHVLEVIGLPRDQWGPINDAYPEVAAAGDTASFKGARNATIFPPEFASERLLKFLASLSNDGRSVYRISHNGDLVAVLIHIHARHGGYDSVHIYRSRPKQRGRWW